MDLEETQETAGEVLAEMERREVAEMKRKRREWRSAGVVGSRRPFSLLT